MRSDINRQQVQLGPFLKSDFDLALAESREVVQTAKPAATELVLGIDSIKLTKKTEAFGVIKERNPAQIGSWATLEDSAMWEFDGAQPGVYDVFLEVAHGGGGGSTFDLECAGTKLKGTVPNTGNWTVS